jgi:hypothetical protein
MSDADPGGEARGPRAARQLDRAPGERYAAGAGGPAGRSVPVPATSGGRGGGIVRALLVADAVALAGALVIFGLGQVDLGPGLLAASAAVGWAVALALLWGGRNGDGNGAALLDRGTRMAVAVGLAAAAILLGFVLDWAWARAEGGVLDLPSYLDQRYGPLAWLNVLVAAAVAALRARG